MTIVTSHYRPYSWAFKAYCEDFGVAKDTILRNVGGVVPFNDVRTRQGRPGWREDIKARANASTTYQADRHKFTARPGWYSGHWVYESFTYPFKRERFEYGDGFPAAIPFSTSHLVCDASKADSVALQKVLDKIREEMTSMQGLVTAGELRETVQMLRSPFTRGRQFFMDHLDRLDQWVLRHSFPNYVRKAKSTAQARKRYYRDLTDAATASWLEVNLGIKPLIADVANIAETINRFRDDILKAKVVGTGSDSREEVYAGAEDYLSRVVWKTRDVKSTHHSVRYSAGLSTSMIIPGSNQRLMELFGLNMQDWAPTIWELIPYSFVVDYFSNIGDVINAVTTDTSRVTWLCRSERVQTSIFRETFCAARPGFPGLTQFRQLPARFKATRTTLTRTVPVTLGWPQVQLSMDLKPIQAANTVALLLARSRAIPFKGIR